MATYKLVNADQLNADLKAVADSIRAKTGEAGSLSFPAGFCSSIEGITGGGGAEGSTDEIHTVTFMNGSEVLYVRAVVHGDNCADVVSRGIIPAPTKESTAQYDYYYDGWGASDGGAVSSTILNNITADKTVYAIFASVVRTYTVTYYDDDGTTVLKTETLTYGATPSYSPSKEGAVFDKWIPELATVTGDASYTATWSEVTTGTLTSTISWTLDKDGLLNIIGTGDMPTYTSTSYKNSSLYAYREDIVRVHIENTVTSISEYLFYQFPNLIFVKILSSSMKIGYCAFADCPLTEGVMISWATSWVAYEDAACTKKFADLSSNSMRDTTKAGNILRSTYAKYWLKRG